MQPGAFVIDTENKERCLKSEFTVRIRHANDKNTKVNIELKTKNHGENDDHVDDLSFATNWTRAFKKTHAYYRWLNAFGIINEIAATKIFKKSLKEHFEIKDNIIDKDMMNLFSKYEFVKRRNIATLNSDLI